MNVGDLVILSDRQSTGLVVERTDRTYTSGPSTTYWVLIDAHKLPLIESQIWKVIGESR